MGKVRLPQGDYWITAATLYASLGQAHLGRVRADCQRGERIRFGEDERRGDAPGHGTDAHGSRPGSGAAAEAGGREALSPLGAMLSGAIALARSGGWQTQEPFEDKDATHTQRIGGCAPASAAASPPARWRLRIPFIGCAHRNRAFVNDLLAVLHQSTARRSGSMTASTRARGGTKHWRHGSAAVRYSLPVSPTSISRASSAVAS